MDVMSNPVRQGADGTHFEREAILNWIYRGNDNCPLTRKPLHPSELKLDTVLQARILKWKLEQDFHDSNDSFGDDDSDDDSEFEAAFADILAISSRITSVAAANNRRRAEAEATAVSSTSDATSSSPSRKRGTDTKKSESSRLDDIRNRILQRRDERIKGVLAKEAAGDTQEMDDNISLQYMLSRV